MVCSRCKTTVPDGSNFCGACGTRFRAPTVPSPVPKTLTAVALVMTGLIFIALIGLLASGALTPPATAPTQARLVEYSITGSARVVRITDRNNVGGTEQHEVAVPYHYSFEVNPGAFVYLSAQKADTNGEITVSVTVDGRPLQAASASSPYGIATASGRVP